jgi:ubiquinone/menaquinone biosynthesis C-methylase UbiE
MRGSLAELAGSASADGRLPQAADLATPDPGSPSSVSVSVRSGIRSGRCRLLMSDRYDQDVTAANGEKTRQVGGPGPISGAWERAFAAFYDALLKSTEEAGNAARRNQVLARASGTVIELGAGTGFNLGHYPPDVELILCEPAEPMARRLEDRLTEQGRSGDVVRAPAESLPVEDDVADTVVSTLVLCTVDNPDEALREARRVLKPGGRLLFIEHVAAPEGSLTRRAQRLLHRPWRAFACGCHNHRETEASIRGAGFEIDVLENGELEKSPPIVRPLIWGTATSPPETSA